MITSPYFWIAAIIAALSLFGGGYYLGDKHATNACAAERLEVAIEQSEAAVEQAEEDQEIAKGYETTREVVRTVYVKVKEKARENIDKNPNYDNCSLDIDGLQLYNSRPATPPPSPRVDSTMSGSPGRDGWSLEHDTGEQPGALSDVLRLPSASQIAVGMGGESGVGGTEREEKMSPEDRAQALELLEYEATQRRAIKALTPSLSHCVDCGDEIPAARKKIAGITRCIMCLEDFEVLKKRGG